MEPTFVNWGRGWWYQKLRFGHRANRRLHYQTLEYEGHAYEACFYPPEVGFWDVRNRKVCYPPSVLSR